MFTEAALVLLSDQPVGADGQDDLLFREAAAHRLADLVRASSAAAPFTLAVYADWGMGKSSLLSQVADKLRTGPGADQVRTVWFNAWTAGRADALETLIKSVLGQLDPNTLRRLARRFGAGTRTGAWTRVALTVAARPMGLHRLVDEVWDRLSVDARARNEVRDRLAEVLREWTKGDGRDGSGRMIVVFVDDLDRCPPDVIGTVCDAVKKHLSIPGLVFVLGCDQAVIETSLAVPAAGGGRAADAATVGRRYLEKIVQASYSIPVPTDAEAAQLVVGYARQSGTQALFQGPVAEAVTRHAGRNPRRIKRLINRFVIEYRLDEQWREFGPGALIRVILLQDFYPEFYGLLARTEDLDPIDEFSGYLEARTLAGARLDPRQREQIGRFLVVHGLPQLADAQESLSEQLLAKAERELPECYLDLARDKTFVLLVRELAVSTNDERFKAKLLRRAIVGPVSGDGRSSPSGPSSLDSDVYSDTYDSRILADPPTIGPMVDLRGLHVLWLYSRNPRESASHRQITGLGARITTAAKCDDALRALATMRPDVLLTNLSRAGEGDGFDDLQRIKDSGMYAGEMIVYAGYVSAARRDRADAMNVRITSNPVELIEWLIPLATARRRSPEGD